MLRRSVRQLCSAIERSRDQTAVLKDYRRMEDEAKQLAAAEMRRVEMEKHPLRYQLLDCPPGLPLALTKLKYLLACRRHHPEVGGDPEMFLRVSLAYQDVMKDYGVETVDNQIVNLGNFQISDYDAQQYLEARQQIKSYIPMSTLEDHIRQIEGVKERLGNTLSERIAANDDEAMWLLEDIEELMEETGLKTVRLVLLDSGEVKLGEQGVITDGTERPLFLSPHDSCGETAWQTAPPRFDLWSGDATTGDGAGARQGVNGPQSDGQGGTPGETLASGRSASAGEAGEEGDSAPGSGPRAIQVAEVSAEDIEVLNAKNNVQERRDVAGLASRTSTEVMNNTEEVKEIRMAASVLYVLSLGIFILVYVYLEGRFRAKAQERRRPETMEHVMADTMLPWWGNDKEYESQVKRIFVEEWRSARSNSRRVQTFQDGLSRESLTPQEKEELDLKIFTVTAEKLRRMKEHADQHPGRQ